MCKPSGAAQGRRAASPSSIRACCLRRNSERAPQISANEDDAPLIQTGAWNRVALVRYRFCSANQNMNNPIRFVVIMIQLDSGIGEHAKRAFKMSVDLRILRRGVVADSLQYAEVTLISEASSWVYSVGCKDSARRQQPCSWSQ